nr:cytochrome P450 85A1-like [Ipomoea batatas]
MDGTIVMKNRYGDMYKTHILGGPTVVSNDPDVNRYILMNEAKGLVPGGSLLSLVGTPMIRQHLLPKIEKYMKLYLQNFHGRKTIDIQQETLGIVDSEPSSLSIAFKQEFDKMADGAISLPLNIPGLRRRGSKEMYNDLVDQLLGKVETKYELSDEQIYDQIITILYSGYETLSKTSMMCLKYLHDHPKALQHLRDEHFKIREGKTPDDPITWDDYKSMTFTRAVILETLRLSTVVNGVLRQTTQDLVLNGSLIPKAWRIFVYVRELNYDPIVYPEPYAFNPWRWLEDKNLESHNYYLAFGGGCRLCPGKEWGIVKISIFLHHFVTQYRWEEIEEAKIKKFPRVEAVNGLHVRIDSMQQDIFPQGALCKCYFFDNLGQFCPISGDDCDQRFSDALHRRFLRQVRINDRKRRIPDTSKGRECVSEDQSDTDVRFYIQHLMRKLGSNSYTGQRIILSVSQRISLVAEGLLFMDPFDGAFPNANHSIYLMIQLIEFLVSDYLLSWSISEEFDTRVLEEWVVSVVHARKALEVLECRSGLYVVYMDRVVGIVAKQVDFSLSASSDLQRTKAAEKLSSEVKRKGRTIPVSSGGSAAAAAARPKTKSSSSPHISVFHVYYLLLFSVFSAFLLL